ncbi:MAG: dihydrodipicolinate synthase family protein [Candidatus Thorarchaeota archaeon]
MTNLEEATMEHVKLKEALAGVSVTNPTPFTKDLSQVDTDGLSRNLRFIADEGIGMVVPCGNTGEFYSLSEKEWAEVVRTTVDTIGGRMTVMAGIGHSLTTAIDMLERAAAQGADGVMVMYPQHVFSSEEGILHYYQRILDSAGEIGVVLYKKGPLLSDEVLNKIKDHPRLVGVKYAFGRIVDFARTVQNVGKSITWSCGTSERFAPFFWLAGAEGFTSGLGNFAPHISLQMIDGLRNEKYNEVMRLQEMISPLEFLREGRGAANNVPVVKAMLDHIGLVGGECRPPIHSLTPAERKSVIKATAGWDLKRE